MSEKRLKVAVIGAGMIANAGHIPAWKSCGDDAEVVAVFNRSIERAQQTAARHDIPHAYDDCAKMLAEVQPDIACVCTPNVSHKEYALAAFEAGAHVFCEKPIAACYADAVEMFERAEERARILFVTQTGRFANRTLAAKEVADSGQLGDMLRRDVGAAPARRADLGPLSHQRRLGWWTALRFGRARARRPAVDHGRSQGRRRQRCHLYQDCQRGRGIGRRPAASGAPVGVYEPRPYSAAEYDVEDMAAGFLRLDTGATISLKASWAANIPDGTGTSFILGDKAGLRLDPLTLIGTAGRYQADTVLKVPADPDVPFYGHWKAAAHFVRVLRGDEELMIEKDQVLNVIGALDALYRSAEAGSEVRL